MAFSPDIDIRRSATPPSAASHAVDCYYFVIIACFVRRTSNGGFFGAPEDAGPRPAVVIEDFGMIEKFFERRFKGRSVHDP
jgi:hypothetical protein